ncbi:hypothetical protein [Corynebacterium matruchotii]|uniref:hypothetical protein n=1 Tax=Corynebacterium matruchotii TaxID=43768 RepID=UPI0028ED451F|nr:hypothetical protein [Corynebacterium matruchotii]
MRRPFCIIQRFGRATGSGGRSGTGTTHTIHGARVSRTVAAAMSGLIVLATSMIPVAAATVDVAAAPARTQIIMMKDNGEVIETPGAHESRASLSIVKLYLGHWVLQHGAPEDKALVYEMIRSSHDGIASNLDRKYRQAIPDTIGRFRLAETNYRGRWGDTTTSVHDMAAFVRAVRTDPAARPLIDGMRNPAAVAADGYPQNFGTATLPGIEGTKFGWSDKRDVHATVSFGPGFVVAAHTFGSAQVHTDDVRRAVHTDGPVAGTQQIQIGGVTIPVASGAELKARTRCTKTEQFWQGVPDTVLVPRYVLDVIPAC